MNRLLIAFVLVFSMALSSQPVAAQAAAPDTVSENVPALLVKASEAFSSKDYTEFRAAMERLHQLRPYNSEYMYQLVIARALLDDARSMAPEERGRPV